MADVNLVKLFFNEQDPVKSFLDELEKIPDGQIIEAMFHPAKGKNAEDWRKKDLALLTSNQVINHIKQRRIRN